MTATCLPNHLPAATLANSVFSGVTLYSGVTIPTYSSTSPTFALWNPAGSGRLLMPIGIQVGVEATGTAAIGALGLSKVESTTSSFATGLPIAAWTDATVYTGRIGRSGGNLGRFALAATLTAAGTFFYHLGLGLASAAAGTNYQYLSHDFNGKLLLEPGTLIHVVGVPVGPGQPLTASIDWVELDLNGNLLHTP
jgi:hypothetical protein